MKKILSYLFAVSTACTFSLRKFEESGVFKEVNQQKPEITFVGNGNQIDKVFYCLHEMLNPEAPELEGYFVYLYDPISKYLAAVLNKNFIDYFPNRELQFQAFNHTCNVLLGNTYPNLEESKKSLGVSIKDQNLLQFMTNHPDAANYLDLTQFIMRKFSSLLFFMDTDQAPNTAISIKQWIEKDSITLLQVLNESVLKFDDKGLDPYMWDKESVFKSGIKVNSTLEGVKLTKILKDGTEKTIDFQKALDKYLKKQKSPVDDFSQSLIELFNLVKSKKTDSTNLYKKNRMSKGTKKEESLVKEFLEKKEKFCLIEKQQELLESSEILTIRYIISGQEVADTNGKCTIIGTAIDKRTLTTFHWITELDKELKDLFED